MSIFVSFLLLVSSSFHVLVFFGSVRQIMLTYVRFLCARQNSFSYRIAGLQHRRIRPLLLSAAVKHFSSIGSRDFSRHLTNGGSYTKSSRPPLFPSFTLPCLCGRDDRELIFKLPFPPIGWLGSRVVSMLDSGAVGPGFKSQPRRCRVTVLGKLFTTIVPLFTKQRN